MSGLTLPQLYARQRWRRCLVVKRADSLRRGFEFESCTYRNKNTIGEGSNGKPSHKIRCFGIVYQGRQNRHPPQVALDLFAVVN